MKKIIPFFCAALLLSACQSEQETAENADDMTTYSPKDYVQLQHPEWSRDATIYEVNVRQYTKEGTFEAFSAHLPRLKEMGVDILWLMPIHPIGEKNRKGELGSYYAVKDYYGVNPEFGTMDDLKALVDKAHSMGMYVIIDWVANHSAWDNPLVEEHPEWYSKDDSGNFQPTPWYDWSDIIDFDFEQPGLREYMTKAMKFWVEEADIDGFRCDVAGFIPVDFWNNVRRELSEVKPVFMLAEWESRDLHAHAFDMTYAWELWNHLHDICAKGGSPLQLERYMAHDVNSFPSDGYRMTFIDNHDKNSWEGNMYSNFGDGLEAAIAFSCVVRGMPLLYSGQEAGLDRSLAFFEKDEIEWVEDHPIGNLYTQLFALKHRNKALHNGKAGGVMQRVVTDNPEQVIGIYREKDGYKVLALFNLSNSNSTFTIGSDFARGAYRNVLTGNIEELKGEAMELDAWQFRVYELTPSD
jgi:cyclomaltodextrinase